MTEAIIQVEGLGKRYTLGARASTAGEGGARYRTLRESLSDGARRLLRRGANGAGNGTPAAASAAADATDFWALKDVSFSVAPGEVVGIIGRNGAGKSTLLKILSRITEPTEGRIKIKGRVASLLEVGTGFHPELTGRENIFLNGAILGMHRTEIKAKFDEIVAFAEVEKFLDTPVKRYSSGMYVRLAFAVAAHLEPEILIVDEVLAVGDTEFQKKCLGKMQEVAKGQGRTVLFVSHYMPAVRALCERALLLEGGHVTLNAEAEQVIGHYLSEGGSASSHITWLADEVPTSPQIRFLAASVTDAGGETASVLSCEQSFYLVLEVEVLEPLNGLRIGFFMQNQAGLPVCGSNDPECYPNRLTKPGRYVCKCEFPGGILNEGIYSVFFGADVPPYQEFLVKTDYCLSFAIEDLFGHGPTNMKLPGVVRPNLTWSLTAENEACTSLPDE